MQAQIFLKSQFFFNQNFFGPQIFGTKNFSDQKFLQTPKFFRIKIFPPCQILCEVLEFELRVWFGEFIVTKPKFWLPQKS